MSGSVPADVQAVAKSWESACRSLDVDRILSHLSEDATVWYNFDPETVHDRNAYRAILDNSAKGFRNQQYKDMRVHYHPGGFVEQATLQGDTDNGVIETPFLLVATVATGKILRIEEYFDTTTMHQARLAGE